MQARQTEKTGAHLSSDHSGPSLDGSHRLLSWSPPPGGSGGSDPTGCGHGVCLLAALRARVPQAAVTGSTSWQLWGLGSHRLRSWSPPPGGSGGSGHTGCGHGVHLLAALGARVPQAAVMESASWRSGGLHPPSPAPRLTCTPRPAAPRTLTPRHAPSASSGPTPMLSCTHTGHWVPQ